MQADSSNRLPASNQAGAIIAMALALAVGVGAWIYRAKTQALRVEAREQAQKLLAADRASASTPRASLADSGTAAEDQAITGLSLFMYVCRS
jgi:hypothetical protein